MRLTSKLALRSTTAYPKAMFGGQCTGCTLSRQLDGHSFRTAESTRGTKKKQVISELQMRIPDTQVTYTRALEFPLKRRKTRPQVGKTSSLCAVFASGGSLGFVTNVRRT